MYFHRRHAVAAYMENNFPLSIATKEILPILKRDTGYLSKHNIEILDRRNLSVEIKKINLKKMMLNIIETHQPVRERFEGAELIDGIKGWGLPLGSKKRKISGNGFLLVGDAASLIDPFTGEGIGNGMISGMIAARQIQLALEADCFDEKFLSAYDKKIYETLGSELRLSRKLQGFARYEWPFNMVINNASKNKEVRNLLTSMFEDVDLRMKLSNPKFYFRLLFNRN